MTLTLEQMEKVIVKLTEMAQATHGCFMPDCGGDFCPDDHESYCKGCEEYGICERGTGLGSACHELQEIMEGK